MRTTRLIIAPLVAAALAVAAISGPAGAVPADTHNQPPYWEAGKSTIHGSRQSDTANPNGSRPSSDVGVSDATVQSPAPPTWPANPQPIADSHAVVNAPASGLDWGSAGIGAAAGIGAFAIVLALTGLRRRRIARPRSLTTQ